MFCSRLSEIEITFSFFLSFVVMMHPPTTYRCPQSISYYLVLHCILSISDDDYVNRTSCFLPVAVCPTSEKLYIEICVLFFLFSLRFRVSSNPNTEDVIHIPLIRIQLISVSEHMLICHFIEKVKCIFYLTCPLLCILSQRSLIRESQWRFCRQCYAISI